jgi:hypothetical protein
VIACAQHDPGAPRHRFRVQQAGRAERRPAGVRRLRQEDAGREDARRRPRHDGPDRGPAEGHEPQEREALEAKIREIMKQKIEEAVEKKDKTGVLVDVKA